MPCYLHEIIERTDVMIVSKEAGSTFEKQNDNITSITLFGLEIIKGL